MHRRQGTFTEGLASLALSILERVADAWRRMFFVALIAPLNDPARIFNAKQAWAMVHHLYRSEAYLARAIHQTARRLAGLPRVPAPIEPFYMPKLKSPWHVYHRMLRHTWALENARASAIRLARRWRREAEAHARDPLAALRGAAAAAAVEAEAEEAPKNSGSEKSAVVVAVVGAAGGIRAPPCPDRRTRADSRLPTRSAGSHTHARKEESYFAIAESRARITDSRISSLARSGP